MKIVTGESVIVVLQNPREKLVGILDEINVAGISLRAVDLGYFDEWARSIKHGEPYLPMQDYFVPMWRVERLTRDENTPEMLSFAEQFREITGYELGQF